MVVVVNNDMVIIANHRKHFPNKGMSNSVVSPDLISKHVVNSIPVNPNVIVLDEKVDFEVLVEVKMNKDSVIELNFNENEVLVRDLKIKILILGDYL